jgi:hypothetical protein
MTQAKKLVNGRMSGKAGGDKGKGAGGKNQVVELGSADFDAKVLKSDDYWLVEFFAPWLIPRFPPPLSTYHLRHSTSFAERLAPLMRWRSHAAGAATAKSWSRNGRRQQVSSRGAPS